VAILAGIDEAGFGPLLGPLVVSSSVFSVEPALLDADLWQAFRRSTGNSRKHLAGRLLIADSKKAFNRARGLGHLERTSLAVLQSLGKEPGHLGGLLAALCPDCLPRLAEYPWYQDLESCPLAAQAADVRIASKVFADDLTANGAKLVQVQSRCLDVAYYNGLVDTVRNKSQVLFVAVTQLIHAILTGFGDDRVRILVDRQGGRAHYREHLLRSFPGVDLRILREDEDNSIYEMRIGARVLRLSFEVGADDRHLPVALASMVSKYVRELLMERINRYFVAMDGNLKPTAGYWKDGRRFVEEVRKQLPHLDIDPRRLIRSR